MPGFLGSLFDASEFPARWHCGPWTPAMGWASQAGDFAMLASYEGIAAALYVLWRHRRHDFGPRASRVLLWFVAFIALCGLTHLANILAFWWPAYRLFVAVKVVSGVVAARTLTLLPGVVSEALALPTREERHALKSDLWREQLARENAAESLESLVRNLDGPRDDRPSAAVEIAELRRILDEIKGPPR